MPSCCRMSATASSTAVTCRFRLPRTTVSVPQLRHGSPSAKPASSSVDMTPKLSSRRGASRRRTRARCEDGALELHRRQKTAAEDAPAGGFKPASERQSSTDVKEPDSPIGRR